MEILSHPKISKDNFIGEIAAKSKSSACVFIRLFSFLQSDNPLLFFGYPIAEKKRQPYAVPPP
jgi:hypothetical protein